MTSAAGMSDLNRLRRSFWAVATTVEPAFFARMEYGNESSRWLAVGPLPFVVAHYFSTRGVGVFVRGPRRTRIGHVREFLFPHRHLLSKALGRHDIRLGESFLLHDRLRCDMTARPNWPKAAGWLAAKSWLYEEALCRVQAGGPAAGA